MEHVVIIGNGISGVTAARNIRKLSKKKITIISSESEYFFSRTALMYVFMGHMKMEHTQPYENDFWKKNNINLVFNHVKDINSETKTIYFSDETNLKFNTLIIASGSKPNRFGWPGQDLYGVFSLYSKSDLEKLEELAKGSKKAVVVGGGLIGIELVEMLFSRNIEVVFLVREKTFWNSVLPNEESLLLNRHILEHHVNLKVETTLDEIISDGFGNVKAIKTDSGEIIECDIVALTVGVSPNIEFLKNSSIDLGIGVKVNSLLETNVKDIYAIGDCAEQMKPNENRKNIEAVWYTGKMMGETVAQTICGKPMEYNPGNWFNSAKFFDIEYQTYGWVFAKPKENEAHFYWEHHSGKIAVRISYDKNNRKFLGINTFGIRMRHEFFDAILIEEKSVDFVMENLVKANFDPEFYKKYEKEITKLFTQQNLTLNI